MRTKDLALQFCHSRIEAAAAKQRRVRNAAKQTQKTNAHEIGVASSVRFHIINVLKMPADYTEEDEDPLVALVQQLELTAGA